MYSKRTIALTGAGISVESGIPDFRSAQGLWSKYNPSEYATIEAFSAHPEKVWEMLWELEEVIRGAKPNKAHVAMGKLEKLGYLDCVITQNVDNLHQEGGSKNVIEYHGNGKSYSCLQCGRKAKTVEKEADPLPRCTCGAVLKPDVVFFGESIPPDALNRSFDLAIRSEAVLVIGTSAVVYPANTIPSVAKRNGATIIEINTEETPLTYDVTDLFLHGHAGAICEALVDEVVRISADESAEESRVEEAQNAAVYREI
jgi:NAD-dependent deacetylase